MTFTATVTSSFGSPSGSVTFRDGSTEIGIQALTNGTTSLTTSSLSVGAHSITASYAGTVDTQASAAAIDQTISAVGPFPTTTSATATPNAVALGEPVVVNATVTAENGVPTGDVTLTEGSTTIGTATLQDGTATFTRTDLVIGPHAMTVTYAGSAEYLASTSGSVSVIVAAGPTTTSIASDLNPSRSGDPVTFSAVVATGGGTPTGTVDFTANGTLLGTIPLVDGQATITSSELPTGTIPVTATYSGNVDFAPSASGPLLQTVTQLPSSIVIGATPNPAGVGQPVAITATVASSAGEPSGTVTFFDGTVALATVATDAGSATFSTSALTAGGHAVTATYNGSATFAAATSGPITETVTNSLVFVDQANPACKTTGTGAGTYPTPYCTINAAATKVVAGVTVQVAAGTYTEKVTVGGSGTAVAPITIAPAPGAIVTVTGGANGFVVTNKSWVTIRGFAVDGAKNPGITISGGSNVTLDGNHVSHSGNPVNGDTAVGIKLSGVTDSLVTNNITDHNSDAGILVNADANNNVISHNESFANARGYVRAAAGIDVRNTTGTVVTGNVSHDNEDSGINLWTGLAQGSNLATNNVTYSNGDHGIDVHNAIDARVVANTVYSNYDSGIEMTTSTGSVLANNISVDNGIGSLRTSGNIRADKASYLTATVNDDLLFLRVPGVMVDWGGVKYSSLAVFRAATGQESRGLEADPRFTNPTVADFHLVGGSPAIDAANTAAPGQPLVDFDGRARYDDVATDSGIGPVTFADRGAFGYRAVTAATQPFDVSTMSTLHGA